MVEGLTPGPGDLVLEYGPGLGAFTGELDRLLSRGADYLGIELDPEFHRRIGQRFPERRFALGAAQDVDRLLESASLAEPSTIISGLPLGAMSAPLQDQILSKTSRIMRPGGIFRTFSYVHIYPTPGGTRLRDLMKRHFDDFEITKAVFRNVPPALVLSGRARGDR